MKIEIYYLIPNGLKISENKLELKSNLIVG